MEPIILASESPRRQEFFRLLGIPFIVIPPEIDESFDSGTSPAGATAELARRKVRRLLEMLRGHLPQWICAADTVVDLDGKILGKPSDREDAAAMLAALQGREHQVATSVALYGGRNGSIDCRSVTSTVRFAPLSPGEIEWYLSTGEWQGAAGAYRIQGIASCFILELRGSFSAVVGLPLRELYVMLRENGYPYGPER